MRYDLEVFPVKYKYRAIQCFVTFKYDHRFCNTQFSHLQFNAQQRAIICLLLLRGRITTTASPRKIQRRSQRRGCGPPRAAFFPLRGAVLRVFVLGFVCFATSPAIRVTAGAAKSLPGPFPVGRQEKTGARPVSFNRVAPSSRRARYQGALAPWSCCQKLRGRP